MPYHEFFVLLRLDRSDSLQDILEKIKSVILSYRTYET